jgi:hypothetical protein
MDFNVTNAEGSSLKPMTPQESVSGANASWGEVLLGVFQLGLPLDHFSKCPQSTAT